MKRFLLACSVLALLCITAAPMLAQTGWGVRFYKGFKVDTTGNGGLNLGWSTGNLGNTWEEGEHVAYLLRLKNVDLTNTNFDTIKVCYDFTRGNQNARFIDLVRSIQVGTIGLTNSQAYPSDTLGTAYPLTTRFEVKAAQKGQGITAFGTEHNWGANWALIDLDTAQVNRTELRLPGAPDEATRCFSITRSDLTAALLSQGRSLTRSRTIRPSPPCPWVLCA